MALTTTDRRRFHLATALTLLALPALWWVNQSENSTAPNVAVAGADVGVDVGADHASGGDAAASSASDASGAAPSTGDTAGAPVEPSSNSALVASTVAVTTPPPPTADEPGPGEIAPVFLDGPTSNVGAGLAEIAVPARPGTDRVVTSATFRNSFAAANGCAVPGVVNGRTVTIVNLDNSRSVSCVTVVTTGNLSDQIVLHTSLFAEIADLTDAPIPVEIRR